MLARHVVRVRLVLLYKLNYPTSEEDEDMRVDYDDDMGKVNLLKSCIKTLPPVLAEARLIGVTVVWMCFKNISTCLTG